MLDFNTLGRLVIPIAAINDVLGWVLLALAISLNTSESGGASQLGVIWILLLLAAFAFLLVGVYFVLDWYVY
jgi:Kef-type K+ transport system membrane component KefB